MQEQNDILKELEGMGSILAKMPRQMPYALPEGYFSELPDQLMARVMEKDVVSELPKTSPYMAPEGYFDQLPAQLLQAVKQGESKQKKPKIISLKPNVWKQMRLAAAAVLLMLMGAGLFSILNTESTVDARLANIPDEAIGEYIHQNIDEFDSQMLENSLTATITTGTGPSQLTEEEITEYLDETGWQ